MWFNLTKRQLQLQQGNSSKPTLPTIWICITKEPICWRCCSKAADSSSTAVAWVSLSTHMLAGKKQQKNMTKNNQEQISDLLLCFYQQLIWPFFKGTVKLLGFYGSAWGLEGDCLKQTKILLFFHWPASGNKQHTLNDEKFYSIAAGWHTGNVPKYFLKRIKLHEI